eukprot:TRINITY_DN9360_c0_g1_i2.p1 TRINITY_DN9360_c0_g1~~TRINITY_DN9360_c0_g1_i2.p1  ORF type:complete len:170 (+),score=19.24 TRINITY_DN9360_c0_g1_i2:253-762(+)
METELRTSLDQLQSLKSSSWDQRLCSQLRDCYSQRPPSTQVSVGAGEWVSHLAVCFGAESAVAQDVVNTVKLSALWDVPHAAGQPPEAIRHAVVVLPLGPPPVPAITGGAVLVAMGIAWRSPGRVVTPAQTPVHRRPAMPSPEPVPRTPAPKVEAPSNATPAPIAAIMI